MNLNSQSENLKLNKLRQKEKIGNFQIIPHILEFCIDLHIIRWFKFFKRVHMLLEGTQVKNY